MEIKHKALHLLINKGEKGLTNNFEQHLEHNIKTTCETLQINYSEIKNINPDLYYEQTTCDSVQWKFITLCFHILSLPEENNDIISVSYLSDIKIAFQFIVSLGLLPNLIPGIGVDMNIRFKNANKLPAEKIGVKDKYYRLSGITKALLKSLEIETLRNIIVENHFNDLLAVLLQLTSAPLKKPVDNSVDSSMCQKFYFEVMYDRKFFQSELHNLILRTHQPLVFRELMFLNGNKKGPNWLKVSIFKILVERVQMNNGVESVIRALFDSQGDDIGENWKYWDILTKLLMTKPNYLNEMEYYRNICGQILRLLNKKNIENKRIRKFETAFILCTKYLFEINENICINYFINPLLDILNKYTDSGSVNIKIGNVTDEIEQNIFILHSIFIDYKTNDKIIPIYLIKSNILILFHLFFESFTSKSKLSKQLIDILVNYIDNCVESDKNNIFNNFLFDTPIKDISKLKNGYKFEINEKISIIESKNNNFNSFLRSDYCIYLLENTKNENFITAFFKYLLQIFITVFQNSDLNNSLKKLTIDAEKKIIVYQMLIKLLENNIILKNLKNNPTNLLIFSENFLKIITNKNIHKTAEYDGEEFQTLFIIIMIINSILKNCENKNLLKDFNILSNLLQKVSIETNNSEIKMLISEILTTNVENDAGNISEYETAINEICSPLIPEQAHGLATIVKLIEKKDPETCGKKQYVLNIFQQNLKSEETFIYLRAIAGLAILAEAFPNIVLETLTDEYAYPKGATEKDNEVRMKLGEVLVRTTSLLGEVTIKYKSLLLNTFLTAARDPDPLIRASSLSNLGEVCRVLGFKLGTIVTEILNCVHDSITYELSAEVRRAAISVIRQLFLGLDQDLLACLKEDILPIYRTLKTTYKEDPDTVTRLQAQLALEELNEIMKKLLAPEISLGKDFVIK